MKKVKDNFSEQAKAYKKYRPEYPPELYKAVLALNSKRDACWDCGTGNGQVAVVLSEHYKKVYATDISENQLKHAEKRPNIRYGVCRAEQTGFKDDTFDLITVAQAIHWFDFEAFNKEAKRVSKDKGALCVWGYGLLQTEAGITKVIDRFYRETTGPYWDEERKYIEDNYRSIALDFREIPSPATLSIRLRWRMEDLTGYLSSWSAVRNYMRQNGGADPVAQIRSEIAQHWGENEIKEVRFPIFMRRGIIEK